MSCIRNEIKFPEGATQFKKTGMPEVQHHRVQKKVRTPNESNRKSGHRKSEVGHRNLYHGHANQKKHTKKIERENAWGANRFGRKIGHTSEKRQGVGGKHYIKPTEEQIESNKPAYLV